MITDITKYFHELKNECDWLSMRAVEEDSNYFTFRDGKFDSSHITFDHGLMMEIVLGDQLIYVATSDLAPMAIKNFFKKGIEKIHELRGLNLTAFTKDLRGFPKGDKEGDKKGEKNKNIERSKFLEKLNIKELIEEGEKIAHIFKKAPNFLSSNGNYHFIHSKTFYINSNGLEIYSEIPIVSQNMGIVGMKNGIVQRRTDHGHQALSFQGDLSLLNFKEQTQRAQNLIKEVNELLDAPDCPSDVRDLLLAPDQMMLQIHESIGHPLELDRILGDERNYAGWSFVTPHDFGKLKYGSELLNISFDPTLKGELASYNYDDAGIEAQKVFLIKEGILLRGLGGSESAKRLGLLGVANFRAQSWNRAPIDRMANINLEPGTSSFDEMIKMTEKGILMQSNRSWSIDDYRNKFQFGCEYARLIENGELKGVVKNPNYRGICIPFWNKLKAVGDRSTFEVYGTPYCGKGEPNQIIRVGHASPACLFQDVDVFGGAGSA